MTNTVTIDGIVFNRSGPTSWSSDCLVSRVNVYDTVQWNSKEPSVFGVNWPGCGTQNISYTEDFVKKLTAAIKLCKMLNNNEL